MTNPAWVEYIVDSAHADTAAVGLLIADQAQRTRRVQLEAARRQVDATERQTQAVRAAARQTRDAIDAASAAQVDAQHGTTRAVEELGATIDAAVGAMSDRIGDSLDVGFLQVQETVREGFDVLDRKFNVLAGVMRGGFELVGRRMVEQTEVLGDIATMTANPLTTAAAEHYRRAVASLRLGWLEEAIPELEQAIEKDRTNPAPHYSLGVARATLNEPGAAFAALGLAVKYSAADPKWAPLAASAAILQRAVATPEQADEVARTIDSALALAPGCAELLLTRAAHRGDRADLVKALTLAPELAIVAIQAGIPGAEDAAQAVYDDATSPVRARLEIQRLVAESGDDGFGANVVPSDVPQAMIGFPSWVGGAFQDVARHARVGIPEQVEAAESSLAEARERLEAARQSLARTRARLAQATERREKAAQEVARRQTSLIAYESLPAPTVNVDHRAGVRGGFRPFIVTAVLGVLLLVVGANAVQSSSPGFAWFLCLVLLVLLGVSLRKALSKYGELRETAAREADVARDLREQQLDLARQRAEATRSDARQALAEAVTVQDELDAEIASGRRDLDRLEAALPALEAAANSAQDRLERLLAHADRFQAPILELVERVQVARVYPLGDEPTGSASPASIELTGSSPSP